MKLGFVITNDKAAYVAREDSICLLSVTKEAALNKQRIKPCVPFGRSPKFGILKKKIAQNFCALFKIGQNCPKKLQKATETVKKLPKIAQNFRIFFKSTPKSY